MINFFLFLSLLFASPIQLTIVLPKKTSTYSLADLKKQLKVVSVTIDDPVYKEKKIFDGFLLNDILKLAGLKLTANNDEIIFTSQDGYSPNTSFDQLKKHSAVLVFREHGKNGFEEISQGKSKISPAPFYLVWDEGKKLKSVPWPYQLAKIEVVNFQKKYDRIYPLNANKDVMNGFLIFKNECLRCHSINLQGGELGPELNIPKNITEYWQSDILKKFIKNTSKFRAKDKMPVFENLSDDDIDTILKYLTYMKDHKFKN